MFNKISITLLTVTFGFLSFVVNAFAFDNVSVRLQQPKSPTRDSSFSLNFVALDIEDRPISVSCYQKDPGSDYHLLATQDLKAGGNSGSCTVNLTKDGTYVFYVTATAGSETVNSSEVVVERRTTTPGNPTNYSKEGPTNCQYRINFVTADDGGKTSSVDIYRSSNLDFTADGGTRITTLWLGSKQAAQYIDNICDKNYYYVIRAFDGAGNGSDLVGDTTTKTIVETVTVSPTPTSSALVVKTSQVGEKTLDEEGSSTDEQETVPTLIQDEAGADVLGSSTTRSPFWKNPLFLSALGMIAIISLVIISRRWRRN